MKLDDRQLRIVILTIAAFFYAMATANSQQFPLLILSNAIPTNSPAIANGELVSETNSTVSVIMFRDIPMSAVIENLARQAGINYLIDARLAKWWSTSDLDGKTREPVVNFRWENLTPKQAIVNVLNHYNLALLEDPFTSVARITYTNQIVSPDEANLIGSETNIVACSECVIRFQDIPITSVLENLARQAGVNYALDPELGYGLPEKNGLIKPEPSLSVRWWNVTPKQGLIAVCYDYDLTISKIPDSGIWLIRAKDNPLTNFVDASLLGSDTGDATTVRFQDVPLDTAFQNLIRQGHVNVILDPAISDFAESSHQKLPNTPTISLRWENVTPRQAIVAICEDYDLVVVKDSATGVVRIEPKE